MKLFINREQSPAFFGGINFILTVKLELTPEEIEAIHRYQEQGMTIEKEDSSLAADLNVLGLQEGFTVKTADNIAAVLQAENAIKDTCKAFKQKLNVVSSYGGKEEIEYT